MWSIVYILRDRVSYLEKAVRGRSALIADLTRCSSQVDAGVQADTENQVRSRTTYAKLPDQVKSKKTVGNSWTVLKVILGHKYHHNH